MQLNLLMHPERCAYENGTQIKNQTCHGKLRKTAKVRLVLINFVYHGAIIRDVVVESFVYRRYVYCLQGDENEVC